MNISLDAKGLVHNYFKAFKLLIEASNESLKLGTKNAAKSRLGYCFLHLVFLSPSLLAVH